ncbi:hypothetical protein CKA34_29035 (plasmid) [Rhizobium sp. 11515TR]|nr:hypothetical protein CKA34_29035 [Rhizobium sp. 11515TR]
MPEVRIPHRLEHANPTSNNGFNHHTPDISRPILKGRCLPDHLGSVGNYQNACVAPISLRPL